MNKKTIFSGIRLKDCDNQNIREKMQRWIQTMPCSLYMYGIYGSGKTWVANAIFNELKDMYPQEYTSYLLEEPEMIAQLRTGMMVSGYVGSERQLIDYWSDCDLLIIDDLGRAKQTERSQEQIYRILNNRYKQNKITIVTSNFTPQELHTRESEGVRFDSAIIARMQPWTMIQFPNIDRRKEKLISTKVRS